MVDAASRWGAKFVEITTPLLAGENAFEEKLHLAVHAAVRSRGVFRPRYPGVRVVSLNV